MTESGNPHRIPEYVNETLQSFYINQFYLWKLCRENYSGLKDIERRNLPLGLFRAALQYNPGRIRSTGAKTDAKSISERPCFLCSHNRPLEQLSDRIFGKFDILVNPYPIFPLHLTIAASEHIPQLSWPLEMIPFVEKMPGLCAFYNGARAGASAPDHLHFQATADCELPLTRLVERLHPSSRKGLMLSTDMAPDGDLPFGFWSWVIAQDAEGMRNINIASEAKGYDRKGISGPLEAHEFDAERATKDLLNTFIWIDSEGLLRIIIIPRSAHRPECFYEKGDLHHTVSPGAVDMAGLVILPEKNDFQNIDEKELREIYAQTALTPAEFLHLSPHLLKC